MGRYDRECLQPSAVMRDDKCITMLQNDKVDFVIWASAMRPNRCAVPTYSTDAHRYMLHTQKRIDRPTSTMLGLAWMTAT